MKKIREKIRKFRVGEKGFTLIELIVVIAIIGILAAIGAVAYSGYIESANQAADEQVLSNFSYAIQLGAADEGMTDTSGDSDVGYVSYSDGTWSIVYTGLAAGETGTTTAYSDGVSFYAATLTQDITTMDQADVEDMVAQWLNDGVGSDWANQSLKSDLYSSSPMRVYYPSGTIWGEGLSATIADNLSDYTSSSYYNNEETLMEAVDSVASAFGSLVGEGEAGAESLAGLLGFDLEDEEDAAEWAAILEEYGITDASELESEDLGALMVLYMADTISGMFSDDYTTDDFIEGILGSVNGDSSLTITDTTETEIFAYLTLAYGLASAYYTSGQATDDYVSTYESFLSSASTSSDATETAEELINVIYAFMYDGYGSTYNSSSYVGYDTTTWELDVSSSDASTDMAAFVSVLDILSEVKDDFDVTNITWSGDDEDSVYNYILNLLADYGY